MNIALWGLGVHGAKIYRHIKTYRSDYNISEILDINPDGVRKEYIPAGMKVKSAEKVKELYDKGLFEAVLIGIYDFKIKEDVENQLFRLHIPVIPVQEVMDDAFQRTRYPEYDNIISHLQDEQSIRLFKTRLLLIDGIERPFLDEVLNFNKGDRSYTHPIRKTQNGAEPGVILFGTDKDAFVNSTALQLLGVRIRAYCILPESNRSFIYWSEIPETEIIYPEELSNEKYRLCPIVVSSGHERKDIYKKLKELDISADRIFDRPDSERAIITGMRRTQYFDVWSPKPNEVYVDCGAYDGESVRDFYKWCAGLYDKIYALEPVESLKDAILKCCGTYHDLSVITAAAWDKNEPVQIAMGSDLSASSAVYLLSGAKTAIIQGVTLDSIINENVTLLKMDIEGSEMQAINGAENLIRTCKPRLAISIYHQPQDVYDLPVRLLELVPEYKFLIRHYGAGLYETVLFAAVDSDDLKL